MRVYFDTSAMICLVEYTLPWGPRIQTRLAAGDTLVYSDLTRMECRVLPLRLGDAALLATYDGAFARSEFVPITTAVFDRAAHIRAAHGFKTPDAIHLAAATESGCGAFLTNDAQLARYPDVTVEVV
jgi:predicted nucleic acid-binding protein